MNKQIKLNVNGIEYSVLIKPHWTLLDVLRDQIGLMGTKKGCDKGECGACTVIMNGKAILSCLGTVGGNLCLDTRCYYYNQSVLLKKRWEPCFKIGGKTCHVVRGGDSCYAVYSGDMALPLIALSAKVKVIGGHPAKEIGLQRFFSGSGIKSNILKFNEILSEIVIPVPPEHSACSYKKLRLRDTIDFPLLDYLSFYI